MKNLSRRQFIGTASGALVGAVTLGACQNGATGSQQAGAGGERKSTLGSGTKTLSFWEHVHPNVTDWAFKQFTKSNSGFKLKHRVFDPAKQGQALQLAHQSGQLPDIFTLAGLGIPPARLLQTGWLAPLDVHGDELRGLPKGTLLEGYTTFDGKIYGIPNHTFRQIGALLWFNTELTDKADIDPTRDLGTWEGLRKAARRIKKRGGDGTYGWIEPLAFPERMAEILTVLAQAAGAPGEWDPRTGEYVTDTDPFVHAVEFLHSQQKDGLLFPASSSLDARTGRARWATGVAGFFIDGPWNVGVIQADFKKFLDKIDVLPPPVADGAQQLELSNEPTVGTYWLSAKTSYKGAGSALIAQFGSKEYSRQAADIGGAMPPDLEEVHRSSAHATFKKSARYLKQHVFLGPSPRIHNHAAADVVAEMEPVSPDLGTIVQGVFSGDITDYRKALRKYRDDRAKQRDQAIKKVREKGKRVSVDDWVFNNWVRGRDYQVSDYRK